MKTKIIAGFSLLLFATLLSCKESAGSANTPKKTERTEGNKSEVTRTGQHIGAQADSTTIDGPPGNKSNN